VGGGAVLGIGFWMHVDPQTTVYTDLLRTVPTSGLLALFEKLPAVFVLIGGSVAILSFLGCCGACVDSACFISLVRTKVGSSCRYRNQQVDTVMVAYGRIASVTNIRMARARFEPVAS